MEVSQMRKQQYIATVACLVAGVIGFVSVYATDKGKERREAEHPVVVNDCRCLSEHVVFFQHQAPCLTDGGEPFFIFSVLHGLADDFKGFLRVVQRDGDEAFLREAFRCQRIPGVKGKGHGDKGIRQFFRPMMGFQMVFHA